jgi:hypothetical protein
MGGGKTMNVRSVLLSQVCSNVPKRWDDQYKGYSADKQEIGARLSALKPDELTPDRINSIIGNNSWTRNTCDECSKDFDVLFRFGQEPDYDERWWDLCANCLQEAANFAAAYSLREPKP